MGKYSESIADVPCGMTVGITGVDNFILKSGTLIELGVKEPFPIRNLKHSVSPVVRIAVQPVNV